MIISQIQLGPLVIHLYGVIIAIAIFLGWSLAKKRAHLYKIPQTLFDDPILVLPLLLGVIGARLYHVASSLGYYQNNFSQVFQIWQGGLGIWGGLAGAFTGLFLISKIKNINLLSFLDLIAPSFLLGQAIGRFGNYVNQEAFGPPTNLPWAVFIDPANRPGQYLAFTRFHPTFFYEALIDLLFFLILLRIANPSKAKGTIFAFYLIFYGSGRFFVEFFRFDTWQFLGIKTSYILSILIITLGVYLLLKLRVDRN